MSEPTDTLVAFLKTQENAALEAGDMRALRHPSPEGGLDTIGFGHKLTREEVKSGRVYGFDPRNLTIEDAEEILRLDIQRAQRTLDRRLRKSHGVALKDLSPRKRMMLTDYEFNLRGGISSFPSFTGAVIAGDQSKQEDEMTRYYTDAKGVTRPLARNRAFYQTFMSNDARKKLGE